MVNIRTRVATLKIVFCTSKNAALLESKMLQYTTLSTKFHHRSLCEPKKMFSQYQMSLPVSQYNARSNNNTQTRTL